LIESRKVRAQQRLNNKTHGVVMYKGIGFFLALSIGGVLSAATVTLTYADDQRLQVAHPQRSSTGTETTSTQHISAERVVSAVSLPDRSEPLVHAPKAAASSQRVLIRLKSPATQPYLKQQRAQLNTNGKLSRADQQALSKATRSYRQSLQKSQVQLVDTLRNKKYLQQVHNHFVDLTNTVNATVAADSLSDIRALPQVAGVYVDGQVTALLDQSVPVTEAPELWAMRDGVGNNVTGRGITVAILDTGVDYTHPDLGGCVGANCKVVAGYNFVSGEDPTNFMDKHGHGTHVAGIVAANGKLRGVAPDAQLYAYKVLSDSGYGSNSGIIAALEKAVDPDGNPATQDQIDIVNMSLGGTGTPDSPLSEASDNAMQAGTLVVVAAGNSGNDYSTIGTPGNAEHVLTVGATDAMGYVAGFSSRGPIAGENYVKPEIVAPGVDINSVAPGVGYSVKSGTSMAAPHVAGGAALLKQYYPQLTAAEIKDLLISSASDLGGDVFVQGAGAMKLKAAVNTKLLVSPRLLSAGRIDLQQPQFSRDLSVRVKNIGISAQAITFSGPTDLPLGATVNVPSSVSLTPGSSATLSFQFNADTATLPFAESKSLHHRVTPGLQVNGQTINLPLVFSKAALLNIKWGGQPYSVLVAKDDGSSFDLSYYHCNSSLQDNLPVPEAIYLRPGSYHIVTTFFEAQCSSSQTMVFTEDIQLEKETSVAISPESAIYELRLGQVIDPRGNPVAPSRLYSSVSDLSWAREGSRINQSMSIPNSNGLLFKFSRSSEKIKVNTSILFKDKESTSANVDYYFLQKQFLQGINANQTLDLDARTSAGMRLHYADSFRLKRGVTTETALKQLQSLAAPDLATWNMATSLDTYYAPVNFNIYSQQSTFVQGDRFPVFSFNTAPTTDSQEWSGQVFSTGPIAFESPSSFTKMRDAGTSFLEDRLYQSDTRELVVDDSGYFFAGSLSYSHTWKKLNILDVNNFSFGFGVLRDSQQNIFFEAVNYRALCNQTLLDSGVTHVSDFNPDLKFDLCANQRWEFDFPTRFRGETYTSSFAVEMNRAAADKASDSLDSPLMLQLALLSDGKLSRMLTGNSITLQLQARDDPRSKSGLPKTVKIEYALGSFAENSSSNVSWIELSSIVQDGQIVARLPDVIGEKLLSLRITLINTQGVKLVQTLNAAAVIGNNSEPAPVFEPLLALTTEATGPLTAFTLPPVIAKGSTGQTVIASTTDLGPYALGTHQIRWQARNAIGKITEAIQLLTIRDTTPPSLTVPADIRMTAASSLTSVALGEATAVDLVDGAIVASAGNKGPFAVGTHTIKWTATDKSGNTATASQQLVIDPNPQSSSSSAVSGSGNSGGNTGGGSGGGGGNSSAWLLLLLAGLMLRRFVRHQ
jgi:subtilisin family serine protease/uncharacterized membrane protein YgcG